MKPASAPVWKSKFHAIDATPARWRGDAGSSPLDRAHPTHWLISTQLGTRDVARDRLHHVREVRRQS
jgi:hypothetical protein